MPETKDRRKRRTMKKQIKNRMRGEIISNTSAKEKGIHDVSVDIIARIAAPAVQCIVFAKVGFFLIMLLMIKEIKKIPKKTADHIGKYVFIF